MTKGDASRADAGAAVIEFVMVTVLLLMLLFGALQVAAVLYVRSVVGAAAADGARLAAGVGSRPEQGARRANELIARGLGAGMAARIHCVGGQNEAVAAEGIVTTWVRCSGNVRTLFLPLGGLTPISVTGEAVQEVR